MSRSHAWSGWGSSPALEMNEGPREFSSEARTVEIEGRTKKHPCGRLLTSWGTQRLAHGSPGSACFASAMKTNLSVTRMRLDLRVRPTWLLRGGDPSLSWSNWIRYPLIADRAHRQRLRVASWL